MGLAFLATLDRPRRRTVVRPAARGGAGLPFHKPRDLPVGTLAALLVVFTAHRLEGRYRVLLRATALGLALFGVAGARIARAVRAPLPVALFAGATSAVTIIFVRAVVCNERSLVPRRELCRSPAFSGAIAFGLHLSPSAGGIAGFVAAFGLRAGALRFDPALPADQRRPGRPWGRGGVRLGLPVGRGAVGPARRDPGAPRRAPALRPPEPSYPRPSPGPARGDRCRRREPPCAGVDAVARTGSAPWRAALERDVPARELGASASWTG